jgi:sigma-B regulation protein RsbU (phosphoserine phosphatase)
MIQGKSTKTGRVDTWLCRSWRAGYTLGEMGQMRKFEAAVFRRAHRDPPEGFVRRTAFWLLVAYLILYLPGWLPGSVGGFFRRVAEFDFFALVLFSIPLLWRYVFHHLLWKVRNRLIVTYLLMGLTPLVLFVTLTALLLYVFSGQFAIFAASGVVGQELAQIASRNSGFTMYMAQTLDRNPRLRTLALPKSGMEAGEEQYPGMTVAVFRDGHQLHLPQSATKADSVDAIPGWLPTRFRGIVMDHDKLWLRASDKLTRDGHTTVVVTSVPLQKDTVAEIARNLGEVSIFSPRHVGGASGKAPGAEVRIGSSTRVDFVGPGDRRNNRLEGERAAIAGGILPPAEHFYDLRLWFMAPLAIHDWDSGAVREIFAEVTSRPSLLYRRLFMTSLTVGNYIRDGLIAIALVFGVLELLAFLAAIRLNQTITRSVHDLYEATVAIDRGNLEHRIEVKRHDQLGFLSRSFNEMAASLARLLAEQREKEKLQNELAIAQEVQANLFPQGKVALPMLELHGVCLPARTVSGDYYDFLLFGETGLGLALGDISGKGISAALLMATLHSAVRAYRFAGDELVLDGAAALASPRSRMAGLAEMECSELFEEPARILALLNRHLYRSTQPEKYATLFLAHYDGLERRLIYANGGHLPPLLLRANDTVTRLDRGGSVVGLLDGLSWEQGSEQLGEGDILIAYSDGVTEPENDFGEFGEERLLEVVRRHRHLSLEAISEQVVQTLKTWIGGQEQPDDITLVLARQR